MPSGSKDSGELNTGEIQVQGKLSFGRVDAPVMGDHSM